MRFSLLIATILGIPAYLLNFFNSNTRSLNAPLQLKSTVNVSASFYNLQAKSLDGVAISMEQYRGKKVVILNVASRCGYTPQYADWQAFHEKHHDKVVVLGFPCNQFMGQEPGSASDIKSFCQKNYGVTFQMFEKVDVKGANQSPVYKWLSDPKLNGWNKDVPSWNFCKYVIDENGKLTHFFASGVTPSSPEFAKAIGL